RIDGQFRGVLAGGNADVAAVATSVVDPIRHSATLSVAGEIVSVDHVGLSTPTNARVLEVADQYRVLGVGADNGCTSTQELPPQFPNPAELAVSIGMRRAGKPLDIRLEREFELAEQTADGDVANGLQLPGQPSETHANEFALPSRISPCLGLDQAGQVYKQGGTFFSTHGRPAPGRRTRSVGQLASFTASSRRPACTVCGSKPVSFDISASPPCPTAFDIRPATQRRWHSLKRSKTTAASDAHSDADSSFPSARSTTAAMRLPPSMDLMTECHTKNSQTGEQYSYGS